jgi:uncharacterized protein YyaL (SSP411 family)
LLVILLSEAYQVTGYDRYARAIEETLQFVVDELGNGENGYCSALDADSEGVEGKYYTWTHDEIVDILGEDADWFIEYFQVMPAGNWEGVNILWSRTLRDEYCKQQGWEKEEAEQRFSRCLQKLKEFRAQRIRPQLDDKVLLGWNALINRAFTAAYAATGQEKYRRLAVENLQFLERAFLQSDGSWHHTYKLGKSRISAFLDDYAALIQAYIYLQEVTGEQNYLTKALAVTEWVMKEFMETTTGFFFFTGTQQTDVVIRKKEIYDGAVPSGNALMAANLQYLSVVFDRPAYREQAHSLLNTLSSSIIRYPGSFGVWAITLQTEVAGIAEWAVVGQQATRFLPFLLKKFVPNKILQVTETKLLNFPLLSGKNVPDEPDKVLFYQCKNYQCGQPADDCEEFLANV